MNIKRRTLGAGVLAATALTALPARAEEQLKLAVGQRGNWDTSVSELGQRMGFFKKRGLALEILYTAGGGETQQAVLSGSVDLGLATGLLGALGIASKNGPVRIISAETTGAADLFWYVPTASPLKTVADLAGKTVGFSAVGSSTNTVGLMMQAQSGVPFKLVGTGGLPATFTATMSNQIDVGWSAAPFGVDALQQNKIRLLFRGSDVKAAQAQTVRVNVTHASVLAKRHAAIEQYMQAYRETLDWMYSSPDAIKMYADFAGVTAEVATLTREQFFPKSALDPDHISGLESVMEDGVKLKYLAAPLTQHQLETAVQLQKPVA